MTTSPVTREAGAAEPDTKDLAGRRALVTGGTRGMGAAIAELLVARGADVIVTARHREASEPPVRLIQADLASPDGADFVAGEATRILGGLDIVVHCVGASFSKPGGALALTEDDWMQALGTNLLSAVRLNRAVLPGLLEQRSGTIVHVSSLQWKRPHPSSPAYGPARPGVHELRRPATPGAHIWALNDDDAQPYFRQAVELGITLWDTANSYQNGTSEELVGRAITRYSPPRGHVRIDRLLALARAAGISAGLAEWGWHAGKTLLNPMTMPWWNLYCSYLAHLAAEGNFQLGAIYFDDSPGPHPVNSIGSASDPRIPGIQKVSKAVQSS